jgi:hypothetical protein
MFAMPNCVWGLMTKQYLFLAIRELESRLSRLGQVPVGHNRRLEFGFSHQCTWTWR